MAKEKKPKLQGDTVLKNPKQELFCWLYAGYHNRDLFGNGTKCYMQAYGYNQKTIDYNTEIEKLRKSKKTGYTVEIDALELKKKSLYDIARNEASDSLAKPCIRERVDYLIDSYITNEHSDRELQFTIMQRYDLPSKVNAIKERNRMMDRGSAGKLEGNFTFAWEDAPESNTGARKKPIIKKGDIKQTPTVAWEGDEK